MSWPPPDWRLTDPMLWMLGSALAAIVSTNLAWLARWLIARTKMGRRLADGTALRVIGWLLVSLFLLLPPFAAWHFGALSPFYMGLAEVDWVAGLGNGGILAGLSVGLAIFGWLVYRRTVPPQSIALMGFERVIVVLRALADSALSEWHNAFYRAAMIGWLISGSVLPERFVAIADALRDQPLYWGSWLGLSLAAIEWVLNPFIRRRLVAPASAYRATGVTEATMRRAALAVVSTALFVLTRNFWLCLAPHLIVETAIAGWFPLTRGDDDRRHVANAPGPGTRKDGS